MEEDEGSSNKEPNTFKLHNKDEASPLGWVSQERNSTTSWQNRRAQFKGEFSNK